MISKEGVRCIAALLSSVVLQEVALVRVLCGSQQCSPQAVQPRPGPLGLAWLAGLVGLVLAPSRLGRRIDRLENRTNTVRAGGCELYLSDHSLHYIGR
jgi:hypothetical protein